MLSADLLKELTEIQVDVYKRQSLNQVSCPVLVVCGEKDKTNKRASIELADIMKHSQFKEIPRTGHEVNLESPEELASLLREFYKSI